MLGTLEKLTIESKWVYITGSFVPIFLFSILLSITLFPVPRPEFNIILLDEPTSALDPEMVGEVLDVIKCPNCGAGIVGNKCEFCRSILDNVEFKISSIKKIIDE